MKGLAKLKKFASDLKGKTITDLIEALYFIEVEDERKLEVLVRVPKYRKEGTIWIVETGDVSGWEIEERTRDNAVDFLMMKDMENKYEIDEMTVEYSNESKSLRVHVILVDRYVERPENHV
jgi:hypothetical protein